MLKLELQSRVIASPNIGVTWCVDRALLKHLQERDEKYIHVLLMVVYRNEHGELFGEERFLVPLEQGRHYIPVDKPGEYRIFAAVVSGSSIKRLRRRYFGVDDDKSWSRNMVDWHEECLRVSANDFTCPLSEMSAHLDVEVPDGIFAPKPADWKWVTRWMWFKPNQCQYRKWRPMAYTIQPIGVALWAVLTVLLNVIGAVFFTLLKLGYLMFLLLMGTRFRFIDLSALRHPFQSKIHSLHRKEPGGFHAHLDFSVFGCSADGRKRPDTILWLAVEAFWPGFYLYGLAIVTVIHIWVVSLGGTGGVVFVPLAFPAFAGALYLLYVVVNGLLNFQEESGDVDKSAKGPEPKAAAESMTREDRKLLKQYAMLEHTVSCDAEVLPQMRQQYLPLKTKAILLFADVKAKVCRPFAK